MRRERLESSEKSRKGGNGAVQARTRPVVLSKPLAMSIRRGSEQCAVPRPHVRYDIASEYPQSPSYHLNDEEASNLGTSQSHCTRSLCFSCQPLVSSHSPSSKYTGTAKPISITPNDDPLRHRRTCPNRQQPRCSLDASVVCAGEDYSAVWVGWCAEWVRYRVE